MRTMLVSYDLSPGRDDAALSDRLRSYRTWCRVHRTAWVVQTARSASAIRGDLAPFLGDGDRLYVAALSGEAAWSGLPPEVGTWIVELT